MCHICPIIFAKYAQHLPAGLTCASKCLGGGNPRPHGHHAGNGHPPPVLLLSVESLDPHQPVLAGVVGQDPSVHVVVTLCEVHGGSAGVASNLPDGLWRENGRKLKCSRLSLVNIVERLLKDTPEIRTPLHVLRTLCCVPNMLYIPRKLGHLSIQDTSSGPQGVHIGFCQVILWAGVYNVHVPSFVPSAPPPQYDG